MSGKKSSFPRPVTMIMDEGLCDFVFVPRATMSRIRYITLYGLVLYAVAWAWTEVSQPTNFGVFVGVLWLESHPSTWTVQLICELSNYV